jgi:hypothetical protein
MQVITSPSIVPTEGEWIMSTVPDKFVVVFNNDTEFFHGYDRVAILANVNGKVGESETPGKSTFMIGITGCRSVNGCEPDEDLGNHADLIPMCQTKEFQDRLTDALNLWAETITSDQKVAVWVAGNDPLQILESILGRG